MSRILIVEDDVIVRLVVSDALQDTGFHVHEAANAMEAIEILERGNGFDLVLSDIRMPGEPDGLGLLEWVRIHHPTLPIIMTSGYIPDKELTLQPSIPFGFSRRARPKLPKRLSNVPSEGNLKPRLPLEYA